MDVLSQLNQAMIYIEAHIDDDILLADISSVTLYSPYHFGRLFYYIADMSLSEYIRKRKLSLAAIKLQNGSDKVIDLAVMYGYDSADSFTRAFVKQHGVTPTIARQTGVSLTIFPPLTFQIKIKGAQAMNWRIEEKGSFEVFGIERIFGNDEVNLVPDFWTELRENGEYEKLLKVAGERSDREGRQSVFAVCGYNEVEGDRFPYMICALKESDSDIADFKTVRIPKATWAVFRSEKIEYMGTAMKHLFDCAYQEWIPSSGYAWESAPDLEVYYTSGDGKYFEEAWIPVKKV